MHLPSHRAQSRLSNFRPKTRARVISYNCVTTPKQSDSVKSDTMKSVTRASAQT